VLWIVPIYCGSRAGLLLPLAELLSRVFDHQVEQHPPAFDPEGAFDPQRGQYSSRKLLASLLESTPERAERVLGVTSVDLFIPVLTFVFGEAQLDGRAAVVSTCRLENAFYGLPERPGLLLERLGKEAIHELGHTYELLHCSDVDCVMSSSTQIDGIDLKSDRFCVECTEALRGKRPGAVRPRRGPTRSRP
jgi:archaemetzincin